MMHASALVAVALALTGRPSSERGLEVTVEIDPCLSVARSEVLRLTELELDARVVPPRAAPSHATRVDVTCAGKHVHLRVTDPVTGKSLERTLALATHEVDVTGRAVALAIAELVLTSWMELTFPDPPPRAAGFEPPPPEIKDMAEERAVTRGARSGRIAHVLAVAQLQGPFDGFGVGWGGGARLGWNFGEDWLGGDIDLIAAQLETDAELGSVRASTWSSAPRVSFKLWLDPAWLEVSPGFRVGLARLVGSPMDEGEARGGVVAGMWGGPVLYAGSGVEAWHLAFTLGAEAGYSFQSVSGRVDENTSVAVGGPWFAASAGIGWGQ
ncbi:MAG TPA: hypothetical protein VFZ53_29250 [Polyangiaceae bacterium]